MNLGQSTDGPADGPLQQLLHPERQGSYLRNRLGLAGAVFLVLFAGSAIVPIGGAVIGSGQVGVDTRVKRISHPAGGLVASVQVANGQHVAVGQLLLRLDNQVASADATYSGLTVEKLLAQQSRLKAETAGARQVIFPPELRNAGTASAALAMLEEQHLFAVRQSEQAQLRLQLSERIEQYRQSNVSLQAQISSQQTQRKLIEPELQNVRDLWKQNLVTISRVNQMERTAVELEGNIAAQQAQIAQTQARINETREQLIQLDSSRRVQAGEDLTKVQAALNDQRIRRITASDQNSRSEIRAPYPGTVEKLAFTSVGEVIRPAETILEIVPDRDLLVVEAMISPNDVDQVRRGQRARIRFSSFNRAATPEIPGQVLYVASDRTEIAEPRQAYYLARVSIDPTALAKEGLQLKNGMPAEVYIETGSRSLLSYLTKPLKDQMLRSFRDN